MFTDVSEERVASICGVEECSEDGDNTSSEK
jgi:hypothetical protein